MTTKSKKSTKTVDDKATKLAIIYTSGGGSSWAQGSDEDNHILAHRAGKHFKLTWKHMFKNYVFIFMIFQKQKAGQLTTQEILLALNQRKNAHILKRYM